MLLTVNWFLNKNTSFGGDALPMFLRYNKQNKTTNYPDMNIMKSKTQMLSSEGFIDLSIALVNFWLYIFEKYVGWMLKMKDYLPAKRV